MQIKKYLSKKPDQRKVPDFEQWTINILDDRTDNMHLKKGGGVGGSAGHRELKKKFKNDGWAMKKILKSASSKAALEG